MRVFNKIKNKLRSLILKRLLLSGVSVQRASKIDMEIEKLQNIIDPKARFRASEKLINMHPTNPKPRLDLVRFLHKVNDNRQFEKMNEYSHTLKEFLSQQNLEELRNIEFIQHAAVTGSFGSHYTVEVLLRANKYALRKEKKLFLLLPENVQLRNPALFSYFEPYINVIRDSELIYTMKGLESLLTLPIGMAIPMNEICPYLDIAANMVEKERIKLGMNRSLFKLNENHRVMGKQLLNNLGLPDDAWYVTLHIREPSYRGETVSNSTENWRNANPSDYVKACKAITKAGGWVFRMGDPSMTPFAKIPQVIDYAHSEIRSDWMDIFLGATCRFLISTASGYQRVPGYFGVPSIYTNCTHSVPYYGLTEYDLYLPRLLKHKKNGKYLSFEEIMSPPISMLDSNIKFDNKGLQWIDNTSEELEAVTIEMINQTEKNYIKHDDKNQKRFKVIAEQCGEKYGGHKVKAFASMSQEFLKKHANLL